MAFTNSITPNRNTCLPISQIVRDKVEASDHALKFLMAKKQEYNLFEQELSTVLVIFEEIMKCLQVKSHGYALQDTQICNERISMLNIFFFRHFLKKLLCILQISHFKPQAFYGSL